MLKTHEALRICKYQLKQITKTREKNGGTNEN